MFGGRHLIKETTSEASGATVSNCATVTSSFQSSLAAGFTELFSSGLSPKKRRVDYRQYHRETIDSSSLTYAQTLQLSA